LDSSWNKLELEKIIYKIFPYKLSRYFLDISRIFIISAAYKTVIQLKGV